MKIFADMSEIQTSPEESVNDSTSCDATHTNKPSPKPRRLWKWGICVFFLFLIILLGAGIWYETRTSYLQSRFLSKYAIKLFYTIAPGSSQNIVFPTQGPFNKQRGYTRIPEFQHALEARNYHVTKQARFSPELMKLVSHGVTPPYQESPVAGFVMRDADGMPLYDAMAKRKQVFEKFEDIPPLIIKAILFIEDRDLENPPLPSLNPVINWNRFAKAGLLYGANKVGFPVEIEGGSTLATQLEKYRYSPSGNTASVFDKFRQMTAASLKVYKEGMDTRQMRRKIILDYLNTVPLAAVSGYGEIYGLGEGFYGWFGRELEEVCRTLFSPETDAEKIRTFKQALTLLCAIRGPSYYLIQNYSALEKRVSDYINLLAAGKIIDADFAYGLRNTAVVPLSDQHMAVSVSEAMRKAINAIRTRLIQTLGISDYYTLDRLNLELETTLNTPLQTEIVNVLEKLKSDKFLDENGLKTGRLLAEGDPEKVIYSFLLFERTPCGNALRVHADNFKDAFDINRGMKLILGSTAKLRTLAHYLEIVENLYRQYAPLDLKTVEKFSKEAHDPITRWATWTLSQDNALSVEAFLDKAMERTYSANPHETFFTGGGIHRFENFRSSDNGRVITVEEATVRSVNLVFIRLMRDLVKFHKAHLPYDSEAVMNNPDDPMRRQLLESLSDDEARQYLERFYKKYKTLTPDKILARLLRHRISSRSHLAILYFAWHSDVTKEGLFQWLRKHQKNITRNSSRRLFKAYGNPNLTLADYGFLLKKHPLDVWCAGEMIKNSDIAWEKLLTQSKDARRIASAWLMKPKMRKPQDLRLKIRIEEDAFERMTPYWKCLGFPFRTLVPSYSTAIGSSCDQPAALARLIGIILNNGILYPDISMSKMRFAPDTPYHTTFAPSDASGKSVMAPCVAKKLHDVLHKVVDEGTARRLRDIFVKADGTPVIVGGKTGTGDNRLKKFGRGGQLISSKSVNRTATFAFYIGERYYGVITAFVSGPEADEYNFTSSLPVAILKLLAPAIDSHIMPSHNI